MTRTSSALALALALALTALGCRSRATPSAAPSASGSARPKPVARASSSATAPKPPPAPIGCRVLGAKGASQDSPKVGELLSGQAFFDLPAGAELSLRHSETTREFALRGPGRFRVCPKGEEVVVVTRGKVRTTSGPGARAGAEVSLATPFAVLHFGDAALELDVTPTGAEVRVSQGSVAIDGRTAADKAAPPGSVTGPKGRATVRGRVDPTALVAECEKAAGAFGATPPRAATGPGSSLGQWAVERLKARQTARYACSRALSALGLVEGAEATRLWDQVAAKIVVTGSGGPAVEAPEK